MIYITGSRRAGLGLTLSQQLGGLLLSRQDNYDLQRPEGYLFQKEPHIFINCATDYAQPELQVSLAKEWIEKFGDTSSTLINIGSTATSYGVAILPQLEAYINAKQELDALADSSLQRELRCNVLSFNIGRLHSEQQAGIPPHVVVERVREMINSTYTTHPIYRMSIHHDRRPR